MDLTQSDVFRDKKNTHYLEKNSIVLTKNSQLIFINSLASDSLLDLTRTHLLYEVKLSEIRK